MYRGKRKFFPTILGFFAIVLMSGTLMYFSYSSHNAVTFTEKGENSESTIEKYADYWDDSTILYSKGAPPSVELGEQIATVTIPVLEMYERPVYYGSSSLNTNWQITTSGPAGNWGLFGQSGSVANIGAHNWQLFEELPSMKVGDKIIVETSADIYVYEVIGSTVYHGDTDNWTKLAFLDAEDCSVTLMTCYPVDAIDTQDRYLVFTKMTRGTVFSNDI